MPSSVVVRAALCAAAFAMGCRREPPPPPLVAQTAGTIEVAALSAPVRVVRDRWGIPHVYAQSQRDLFVAQGFVQAQDRLFQMDLWRRAAQGRLAEVLGPNFIERDAMTRRVQYRGDLAREWASYGADARSIAEAFVAGVNAWVVLARRSPPEPFVLAGWLPDLWTSDDLLNRTDAFDVRATVDRIAQKQMSDLVADAVRRIGSAPFFTLLAVPAARRAGASQRDRELVSSLALLPLDGSAADLVGASLFVKEARRTYEHPAPRFLIHLHGPGWNVTGATAPWRPGVAIGHNERFAWGLSPSSARAADIVEQAADPAAVRILTDRIVVKGRQKPFEFQTQQTPEGVVIASDRQRGRQFVLRWRGFETGTAPELGALMIDRAATPDAFRDAAARWQLPEGRIVAVERDGQPGRERQPGREAPRNEPKAGEGRAGRAMFTHPLAITPAARERFDVGPIARPASDQQLQARFVSTDWDRSGIANAPGQSESPDSPHFSDMATIWSAGGLAPLAFTDAAVQANSESILMLVPPTQGQAAADRRQDDREH